MSHAFAAARLVCCALAILPLLLPSTALTAEPQPAAVTAVPLEQVQIHPVRSAPGTVVSLNDSRISAEVGGVVEEITVRPGETVQRGDLLVRLDCWSHELAAQQAQALLQAARAQNELATFRLERAATLRERGTISLMTFKERKAAALKSGAEVRRLEALAAKRARSVAKCEIHAPFAGVVVARYASVGELATPGTPLVRLVNPTLVEVSGKIQEQNLASLRAARRIAFVSDGQRYPVQVRSVVPVLNTRVGSYEVRFTLTEAKPAPGETGRIKWEASRPHIPASLLVRREGDFGVFIAVDGRARFHPVPGARAGQPAATDLPSATRIVMEGRYGLSDGEPITIVAPTIETVSR